jgi:redox-sensitive bicupin YhaK (pirin superfamily)
MSNAETHAAASSVMHASTERRLIRVINGELVREGAGVRNIVTIGGLALPDLDPFLLLAEFGGEGPDDYAGGFPRHPHRGFETLTYVLEGRLKHGDSRGNGGPLDAGAVQRMKAARGILHSEMPDQAEGPLRALQLWINLPARDKMDEPGYQDVQSDGLPGFERGGVSGRVLVGTAFGVASPIPGGATDLLFLDLVLEAGAAIGIPLPSAHAAVAYVVDGAIQLGGQVVPALDLAILSPGDRITVAADGPSRLVILAAEPIGEPVARHGPFVMNTQAEIRQAFADFQAGRLG